MKLHLQLAAIALVALSGCQTTDQILDAQEPAAMDAALKRARFEMNCPDAKASVLSKRLVEPSMRASRFGVPDRNEYTIGVEGCGKRETAIVVCASDASGCFASGARP
jgi:hypothetical protein